MCLQRLALHERPAASVRLSLAQGLIADSETDTFKPPRHDSTTTAERFGSDLCPGHGLGGGRRWGQGWHPGPKRPGHQQRPAFGAAQHRGSGGGQSFPSFRHRNPALFPRLLTQEHTGTTTGIGTSWRGNPSHVLCSRCNGSSSSKHWQRPQLSLFGRRRCGRNPVIPKVLNFSAIVSSPFLWTAVRSGSVLASLIGSKGFMQRNIFASKGTPARLPRSSHGRNMDRFGLR